MYRRKRTLKEKEKLLYGECITLHVASLNPVVLSEASSKCFLVCP